MFGNASGGHADVFLPGESHAEKEGHGHPPGRPRPAPAPKRPASGRHPPRLAVAGRAGLPPGPRDRHRLRARGARRRSPPKSRSTQASPTRRSAARASAGRSARRRSWPAAPGGGLGSTAERRRQRRPEADPTRRRRRRGTRGPSDGGPSTRLGTYRDLWAHEVTERSPALRFLMPAQTLELSLADAERLGVAQGDEVKVRSNGHSRQGPRGDPRAHPPRRRAS